MKLVCKITGELIYCYQVPDDGAIIGISVGVSLAIVLAELRKHASSTSTLAEHLGTSLGTLKPKNNI